MGRGHQLLLSITGSSHRSRCILWKPTSQVLINTNTSIFSTDISLPKINSKNDSAPWRGGERLKAMTQAERKIESLSEICEGNKKKESEGESIGGDDRARAKLVALSNAEKEAVDAQAAFLTCATTASVGKLDELYERWKISEQNLGFAYSQAIKYTSRIHHDEEATMTAERLMYQWMDRVMESFGSSLVWMKDIEDAVEDSTTVYLNKKWMIRTIHGIMPRLTTSRTDHSPGKDVKIYPKIRLPPPSSKDYINLLRAYSNSKARRKGQQCEALMKSMMMLANTVSCHYDTNNEENGAKEKTCDIEKETANGVGEEENELWKIWVHESIPNSKAFALAIKVRLSRSRRLFSCELRLLPTRIPCFLSD